MVSSTLEPKNTVQQLFTPHSGISNEIRSERLRSKLGNVDQKFLGFEASIVDESRRRKSLAEARIQDTHDGICTIEKNLNTEIKRRVETNKELHKLIEQLTLEMHDRLHKKIFKSTEKLASTLDSILIRCERLEKQLAKMTGELPSKIQTNTMNLTREIRGLHGVLEEEMKKILEKDNIIFKRLTELEFSTHKKIEEELALQQEQVSDISNDVQLASSNQLARDEQFRKFVSNEIENLKNGLLLTSKAREESDEQILQAINQCAGALQKGLINTKSN